MLLRRAALACSLLLTPLVAAAQAFPERPVSISVGFAPGGSTDIASRLIQAGVAPWTGPNTPEVTRDFLQAELEKYRAVVAQTGIRLER
ncbi:hypothetical protein GGQ83_000498 [Roseococcus suduntuyensis]|uniref:Tripartite tricarboxylate transporter substrate binding protein n=2 Tax=Roseococcus suduntuyensis TaxID=455361 RepID=A0A840A859_9PROT|nr:hypothetical protein [Roseococcus suduntuyensis]